MITIADVRAGVARRFLPTAAWCLFIVLIALAFSTPGKVGMVQLGVASLEVVSMAAGYAAILLTLRSRIKAEARVEGARSNLAGVIAPLLMMIFSVYAQGSRPTAIGLIAGLAGAVAGGLLYLPWIGLPTPDLQLDHVERQALDEDRVSQLLREAGIPDPTPIEAPDRVRRLHLAA